MHISFVSLFPDIFASFLSTSLVAKAQDKWLLTFSVVDPRTFCVDKHQQVDDTVYGGGDGMLIKAQPVIDAVESIISAVDGSWAVIMPTPSRDVFSQKHAHLFAKYDHIIFVCGRYEWIDHRFVQYMHDKYAAHFFTVSLGAFVTLWGETPAMVMTESIVRLLPWVIKESWSWEEESYSIKHGWSNFEHPQYTKPAEVYGYTVPDVLLSGDQGKIEEWKKQHTA